MKKKILYTMCAVFVVICIVYTLSQFTHPTDKEQEQSVFTNALLLVDHSFRNIEQSTKDNSYVRSTPNSTEEPASQPQIEVTPEVLEENTDEELVTIASILDEDFSEDKDATTEEKEKKEEKKKTAKKNTKSSKKSKKTKKNDEVVTVLSISDSSCEGGEIAISIADTYVNIRKEADTSSSIVGKLYKNNAAHIIKEKKDWLYIESGNVKGYVKAEYIKSGLSEKELAKYGTVAATVKTDGLNVREKADTESKRIDLIYMGERYPVLKEKGDWVKLDLKDDHLQGFVKSEYVSVAMSFDEAISIEEELALQKAEEARKADQQAAANKTSANNSTPKKKVGKSTSHSVNELTLLACLVHAEAGNQSYEGKLAVANVVLNRVRSSKYPNSIKGVIYQRGQFSVASSGSLAKQLSHYNSFNTSSQKLSIQAAKDALAGINNIGSRLYFNRYSRRVANKHSGNGVKIDDQFFW